MFRPAVLPVSLSLTLLLAACSPATPPAQPSPEFAAQPSPEAGHSPEAQPNLKAQSISEFIRLQQAFQALPADQKVTELRLQPLLDGGTLVGGRLAGATFALRFPPHWNRQSLVFAHGYTVVGTEPDTVPADPVAQDTTGGVFKEAYARGFAVGQSTYDKRGFAVESGIERTVALSRLLSALGAQRAYIAGASQGGSITELAIERYPQQFAGALAACGVVGGWEPELNYVTHLRALYNYFAAGTSYELPGIHDVTRTAGPDVNTIGLTLLKLYTAAQLQPQGEAARIIRQTVSAVPGVRTQDDIATLLMPLAAQMTGAEDFWAQAGGVFVDNTRTVYRSPLLSEAENAALNRGIQRYAASPAALARVHERWTPRGGIFKTKLLTIHNEYDPLVPTEHETWLREKVSAAGNDANLFQTLVPTTYSRFPTQLLGFEAANHCGFSPEQTKRVWNTLQQWVESGVRPTGQP